ncbi:MAG: aminotransferase class V-fold PLP-dependent enzyme [Proteobacteria bacterium]|jgi:cysteine desulfurase|nr:aminotransferase class V-fold PLP-dependent enzyme [Pseudomonadota bacterium]
MSVTPEIYLDNAATTRPWPAAIASVDAMLADGYGNASSLHRRGAAAARAVGKAEGVLAALVGGGAWKVLFTSGGTESDVTAVLGTVPRGKRDALVTTTVEHAAIAEAGRRLGAAGARCVEIGAGPSGVVDPAAVAEAVDDRTALVSVTHVANEMGTVQPVAEIAARVKAKAPRCRVHVDAVQAAAQCARLEYPLAVDMVSLSAHKIHGPQGVGALLLRPDVSIRPLLAGGDQHGGLRPGTLNAPGIAGFAAAAGAIACRRSAAVPAMAALADRLSLGLCGAASGVRPLGAKEARAPGIVVIAVAAVRPEVLLHALETRGVLASSGAACHSRRREPPRCLRDAGLRAGEGSIRFSLSYDTTAEEVEGAVAAFAAVVEAVRAGHAGDV